ncbi:hypothetical protein Tco_0691691 [Tanacetum coccineum]
MEIRTLASQRGGSRKFTSELDEGCRDRNGGISGSTQHGGVGLQRLGVEGRQYGGGGGSRSRLSCFQ